MDKNYEPGEPMRVSMDMVKNAKLMRCDCGGGLFSEKMMFKKISAILSPTGKEEIYPMNVVVCEKCGKVPTEFNPHNIIPKEFLASKLLTN